MTLPRKPPISLLTPARSLFYRGQRIMRGFLIPSIHADEAASRAWLRFDSAATRTEMALAGGVVGRTALLQSERHRSGRR